MTGLTGKHFFHKDSRSAPLLRNEVFKKVSADLRSITKRRNRETPDYVQKILNEIQAKLLRTEIFICAPSRVVDEIIEARIKGRVYLLNRLIRCGKGCAGCPHGPYWYGYYRSKGSFISFYVGKDLPPRFLGAERIKVKLKKGFEGYGKKVNEGQKVE